MLVVRKECPAYLVFFPESRAVKRVRCVNSKFTNDFDGVIEMSDDSDPLPDAVVDDDIVDENEDEARRYPQRKRNRPTHLENYVAEADINLAASFAIEGLRSGSNALWFEVSEIRHIC